MGFLSGKKLLITGVLSQPLHRLRHRQGLPRAGRGTGLQLRGRALQGPHHRIRGRLRLQAGLRLRRRRRRPDRRSCSPTCRPAWPKFDGFVHSIGFAPREAIAGDFLDGLSREGFKIAHDISAYSFPAMAKAALPYPQRQVGAADPDLPGRDAHRPQLQHHGPGQGLAGGLACATWPNRSGPKGMRVNGISAGPDQDAGRQRHQGLRQDPARSWPRPRRSAATSPSKTWATWPPSC